MAIDRRPLKYRKVLTTLRHEIEAGRWKEGERLPTEAELVARFGVSRITVGRALRELQVAGLIERRAGSGTFRAPTSGRGLSFGLLIPDLGETEIFEPICQGMMASPYARDHALLWGSQDGDNASREERAWQLCRHYIERSVSGVFFAPLEMKAGKNDINRRIANALDEARIPVVLLDRTILPYPGRGHHDLVGIDNRRAGHTITAHLLGLGCRRVGFLAYPRTAATVDAREAGYREALYQHDAPVERGLVQRIDPADREAVRAFIASGRPEAIVCANDRTAGSLMQTLFALGMKVPRDVRLVGIDDVEYASLLPVPLTTLRQPTHQIGDAAMATMLQRVARADLPSRDVLLHCELIVRDSCGA
ncbi:MAG: GntR family transcriptional regulator [Acidobacteria bacterium]|nr:GntR family transcriptional regulator [Acidobacteriota bacterium]